MGFAKTKMGLCSRRWTAVFTLAVFSLTSLYSPSEVLAQNQPAVIQETKTLPADLKTLMLPRVLGKIEDTYQGSSGKTVIVVQDAHAIPDAQKSIFKILRHFQREYGVTQVGVEGANAALDPQIFKSFPDKKLLKETFAAYFNRGELTGSTASAVFTDGGDYRGIEDWDLYETGLGLYLAAMEKEPELNSRLEAWEKDLQARKEKIYSPELLKIDGRWQAFEENQNGLVETLRALAEIKSPLSSVILKPKAEESNVRSFAGAQDDKNDYDSREILAVLEESRKESKSAPEIEAEVKALAEKMRVDLERQSTGAPEHQKTMAVFQQKYQQFKTSQLSPQAFAIFMKRTAMKNKIPLTVSAALLGGMKNQKTVQQLEGTRFFRDLEKYAQSVKESLMSSEEQRALDRESRQLMLAKKLVKLELSREEWNEIKTYVERRTSNGENIKTVLGEVEIQKAFYENAESRDQAFLSNLEKQWPERRSTSGRHGTILIAGGFHAQGLTQRLRDRKISYVLVMPKIRDIPKEIHYRAHMQGVVSWKNYFKVENGKINLFEAFVRGTRDQLLAESGERIADRKDKAFDPNDPSTLSALRYPLKAWRDQIIRDLAQQKRIEKAGDYTRFLDEVVPGNSQSEITVKISKSFERVNQFLSGLQKLDAQRQVTDQNIANLLRFGSAAEVVTASALSNSSVTPFDRLGRHAIRSLLVSPVMRAEWREGDEAILERAILKKEGKKLAGQDIQEIRLANVRDKVPAIDFPKKPAHLLQLNGFLNSDFTDLRGTAARVDEFAQLLARHLQNQLPKNHFFKFRDYDNGREIAFLDEELKKIKFAIREILTNGLYHGNQLDPFRPLYVSWSFTPSGKSLTLKFYDTANLSSEGIGKFHAKHSGSLRALTGDGEGMGYVKSDTPSFGKDWDRNTPPYLKAVESTLNIGHVVTLTIPIKERSEARAKVKPENFKKDAGWLRDELGISQAEILRRLETPQISWNMKKLSDQLRGEYPGRITHINKMGGSVGVAHAFGIEDLYREKIEEMVDQSFGLIDTAARKIGLTSDTIDDIYPLLVERQGQKGKKLTDVPLTPGLLLPLIPERLKTFKFAEQHSQIVNGRPHLLFAINQALKGKEQEDPAPLIRAQILEWLNLQDSEGRTWPLSLLRQQILELFPELEHNLFNFGVLLWELNLQKEFKAEDEARSKRSGGVDTYVGYSFGFNRGVSVRSMGRIRDSLADLEKKGQSREEIDFVPKSVGQVSDIGKLRILDALSQEKGQRVESSDVLAELNSQDVDWNLPEFFKRHPSIAWIKSRGYHVLFHALELEMEARIKMRERYEYYGGFLIVAAESFGLGNQVGRDFYAAMGLAPKSLTVRRGNLLKTFEVTKKEILERLTQSGWQELPKIREELILKFNKTQSDKKKTLLPAGKNHLVIADIVWGLDIVDEFLAEFNRRVEAKEFIHKIARSFGFEGSDGSVNTNLSRVVKQLRERLEREKTLPVLFDGQDIEMLLRRFAAENPYGRVRVLREKDKIWQALPSSNAYSSVDIFVIRTKGTLRQNALLPYQWRVSNEVLFVETLKEETPKQSDSEGDGTEPESRAELRTGLHMDSKIPTQIQTELSGILSERKYREFSEISVSSGSDRAVLNFQFVSKDGLKTEFRIRMTPETRGRQLEREIDKNLNQKLGVMKKLGVSRSEFWIENAVARFLALGVTSSLPSGVQTRMLAVARFLDRFLNWLFGLLKTGTVQKQQAGETEGLSAGRGPGGGRPETLKPRIPDKKEKLLIAKFAKAAAKAIKHLAKEPGEPAARMKDFLEKTRAQFLADGITLEFHALQSEVGENFSKVPAESIAEVLDLFMPIYRMLHGSVDFKRLKFQEDQLREAAAGRNFPAHGTGNFDITYQILKSGLLRHSKRVTPGDVQYGSLERLGQFGGPYDSKGTGIFVLPEDYEFRPASSMAPGTSYTIDLSEVLMVVVAEEYADFLRKKFPQYEDKIKSFGEAAEFLNRAELRTASSEKEINVDLVGGAVNLEYLERLQTMMNTGLPQEVRGLEFPQTVGLYLASGADASNAFMATNADRMIFVNQHSFYGVKNKADENRKDFYLNSKKGGGWNATGTVNLLGGVFPMILVELEAMKIEENVDDLVPEELQPGVLKIEFTWQGKRRELIYIEKMNSAQIEAYAPIIKEYGVGGKVHYFMAKASEAVFGQSNGEPIPDIVTRELLSEDGFVVMDTDANLPVERQGLEMLLSPQNTFEISGVLWGYGSAEGMESESDGAYVFQKKTSRAEERKKTGVLDRIKSYFAPESEKIRARINTRPMRVRADGTIENPITEAFYKENYILTGEEKTYLYGRLIEAVKNHAMVPRAGADGQMRYEWSTNLTDSPYAKTEENFDTLLDRKGFYESQAFKELIDRVTGQPLGSPRFTKSVLNGLMKDFQQAKIRDVWVEYQDNGSTRLQKLNPPAWRVFISRRLGSVYFVFLGLFSSFIIKWLWNNFYTVAHFFGIGSILAVAFTYFFGGSINESLKSWIKKLPGYLGLDYFSKELSLLHKERLYNFITEVYDRDFSKEKRQYRDRFKDLLATLKENLRYRPSQSGYLGRLVTILEEMSLSAFGPNYWYPKVGKKGSRKILKVAQISESIVAGEKDHSEPLEIAWGIASYLFSDIGNSGIPQTGFLKKWILPWWKAGIRKRLLAGHVKRFAISLAEKLERANVENAYLLEEYRREVSDAARMPEDLREKRREKLPLEKTLEIDHLHFDTYTALIQNFEEMRKLIRTSGSLRLLFAAAVRDKIKTVLRENQSMQGRWARFVSWLLNRLDAFLQGYEKRINEAMDKDPVVRERERAQHRAMILGPIYINMDRVRDLLQKAREKNDLANTEYLIRTLYRVMLWKVFLHEFNDKDKAELERLGFSRSDTSRWVRMVHRAAMEMMQARIFWGLDELREQGTPVPPNKEFIVPAMQVVKVFERRVLAIPQEQIKTRADLAEKIFDRLKMAKLVTEYDGREKSSTKEAALRWLNEQIDQMIAESAAEEEPAPAIDLESIKNQVLTVLRGLDRQVTNRSYSKQAAEFQIVLPLLRTAEDVTAYTENVLVPRLVEMNGNLPRKSRGKTELQRGIEEIRDTIRLLESAAAGTRAELRTAGQVNVAAAVETLGKTLLRDMQENPAEFNRLFGRLTKTEIEKIEFKRLEYFRSGEHKDVFKVEFDVQNADGQKNVFTLALAMKKPVRAGAIKSSETAYTKKISEQTGHDGSLVPVFVKEYFVDGDPEKGVEAYFEEFVEGDDLSDFNIILDKKGAMGPLRSEISKAVLEVFDLTEGHLPVDLHDGNIMIRSQSLKPVLVDLGFMLRQNFPAVFTQILYRFYRARAPGAEEDELKDIRGLLEIISSRPNGIQELQSAQAHLQERLSIQDEDRKNPLAERWDEVNEALRDQLLTASFADPLTQETIEPVYDPDTRLPLQPVYFNADYMRFVLSRSFTRNALDQIETFLKARARPEIRPGFILFVANAVFQTLSLVWNAFLNLFSFLRKSESKTTAAGGEGGFAAGIGPGAGRPEQIVRLPGLPPRSEMRTVSSGWRPETFKRNFLERWFPAPSTVNKDFPFIHIKSGKARNLVVPETRPPGVLTDLPEAVVRRLQAEGLEILAGEALTSPGFRKKLSQKARDPNSDLRFFLKKNQVYGFPEQLFEIQWPENTSAQTKETILGLAREFLDVLVRVNESDPMEIFVPLIANWLLMLSGQDPAAVEDVESLLSYGEMNLFKVNGWPTYPLLVFIAQWLETSQIILEKNQGDPQSIAPLREPDLAVLPAYLSQDGAGYIFEKLLEELEALGNPGAAEIIFGFGLDIAQKDAKFIPYYDRNPVTRIIRVMDRIDRNLREDDQWDSVLRILRFFSQETVVLGGKEYRLKKTGFLKNEEGVSGKGKSPLFKVDLIDIETGREKSFLFKWAHQNAYENERVAGLVARNVLGLPGYDTDFLRSFSRDASHAWQLIEFRDSRLIAYETSSFLGRNFLTQGLPDFLAGSSEDVLKRARNLGAIFAAEYVLNARDAEAKHILLDRQTGELFRIDWEYLWTNEMIRTFDEKVDLQKISGVLEGDERLLLAELLRQPNGEALIAAVVEGFDATLEKARADLALGTDSNILEILDTVYPSGTAAAAKELVLSAMGKSNEAVRETLGLSIERIRSARLEMRSISESGIRKQADDYYELVKKPSRNSLRNDVVFEVMGPQDDPDLKDLRVVMLRAMIPFVDIVEPHYFLLTFDRTNGDFLAKASLAFRKAEDGQYEVRAPYIETIVKKKGYMSKTLEVLLKTGAIGRWYSAGHRSGTAIPMYDQLPSRGLAVSDVEHFGDTLKLVTLAPGNRPTGEFPAFDLTLPDVRAELRVISKSGLPYERDMRPGTGRMHRLTQEKHEMLEAFFNGRGQRLVKEITKAREEVISGKEDTDAVRLETLLLLSSAELQALRLEPFVLAEEQDDIKAVLGGGKPAAYIEVSPPEKFQEWITENRKTLEKAEIGIAVSETKKEFVLYYHYPVVEEIYRTKVFGREGSQNQLSSLGFTEKPSLTHEEIDRLMQAALDIYFNEWSGIFLGYGTGEQDMRALGLTVFSDYFEIPADALDPFTKFNVPVESVADGFRNAARMKKGLNTFNAAEAQVAAREVRQEFRGRFFSGKFHEQRLREAILYLIRKGFSPAEMEDLRDTAHLLGDLSGFGWSHYNLNQWVHGKILDKIKTDMKIDSNGMPEDPDGMFSYMDSRFEKLQEVARDPGYDGDEDNRRAYLGNLHFEMVTAAMVHAFEHADIKRFVTLDVTERTISDFEDPEATPRTKRLLEEFYRDSIAEADEWAGALDQFTNTFRELFDEFHELLAGSIAGRRQLTPVEDFQDLATSDLEAQARLQDYINENYAEAMFRGNPAQFLSGMPTHDIFGGIVRVHMVTAPVTMFAESEEIDIEAPLEEQFDEEEILPEGSYKGRVSLFEADPELQKFGIAFVLRVTRVSNAEPLASADLVLPGGIADNGQSLYTATHGPEGDGVVVWNSLGEAVDSFRLETPPSVSFPEGEGTVNSHLLLGPAGSVIVNHGHAISVINRKERRIGKLHFDGIATGLALTPKFLLITNRLDNKLEIYAAETYTVPAKDQRPAKTFAPGARIGSKQWPEIGLFGIAASREGKRIFLSDPEAKTIYEWNGKDKTPKAVKLRGGSFSRPEDLALNTNGTLFVLDRKGPGQDLIRQISPLGQEFLGDIQWQSFVRPDANRNEAEIGTISINEQNELLVSFPNINQVMIFDAAGNHLRDIQGPLPEAASGVRNEIRTLLRQLLQMEPFQPLQTLLKFNEHPLLALEKPYHKPANVEEGYTLGQHTLMVMSQFEKYFSKGELPLGVSRSFMRLLLMVHDLGKPFAVGGLDQHQETIKLLNQLRKDLPLEPFEFDLLIALIDGDPLGSLMQNPDIDTLTRSAKAIENKAQALGVDVGGFFDLLTIYYQVDAGSYTADAGGMPAHDFLFEKAPGGGFLFDASKNRLIFSPGAESIFDLIEKMVKRTLSYEDIKTAAAPETKSEDVFDPAAVTETAFRVETTPEGRERWMRELEELNAIFGEMMSLQNSSSHMKQLADQASDEIREVIPLSEKSLIPWLIADTFSFEAFRRYADTLRQYRVEIEAAIANLESSSGISPLLASLWKNRDGENGPESLEDYLDNKHPGVGKFNVAGFWESEKLSNEEKIIYTISMMRYLREGALFLDETTGLTAAEYAPPQYSEVFAFLKAFTGLSPEASQRLFSALGVLRKKQIQIVRWEIMNAFPYIKTFIAYHQTSNASFLGDHPDEITVGSYLHFSTTPHVVLDGNPTEMVRTEIPIEAIVDGRFLNADQLVLGAEKGNNIEFIVVPGAYPRLADYENPSDIFEEILLQYDLTSRETVSAADSGSQKIYEINADQGSFLLKRAAPGSAEAEIAIHAELLPIVSPNGPRIYLTRTGEASYRAQDGYLYVLYSRVKGSNPNQGTSYNKLSPAQLSRLASFLGEIHTAFETWSTANPSKVAHFEKRSGVSYGTIDPAVIVKKYEGIIHFLNQAGPQFKQMQDGIQAFRDEVAFLAERVTLEDIKRLPSMLIAGDFNSDSVIFDEQGYPRVLNLESIILGPRVLDLVKTDFVRHLQLGPLDSHQDRDFSAAHTRRFLLEYHRQNPLSEKEWDSLPVLLLLRTYDNILSAVQEQIFRGEDYSLLISLKVNNLQEIEAQPWDQWKAEAASVRPFRAELRKKESVTAPEVQDAPLMNYSQVAVMILDGITEDETVLSVAGFIRNEIRQSGLRKVSQRIYREAEKIIQKRAAVEFKSQLAAQSGKIKMQQERALKAIKWLTASLASADLGDGSVAVAFHAPGKEAVLKQALEQVVGKNQIIALLSPDTRGEGLNARTRRTGKISRLRPQLSWGPEMTVENDRLLPVIQMVAADEANLNTNVLSVDSMNPGDTEEFGAFTSVVDSVARIIFSVVIGKRIKDISELSSPEAFDKLLAALLKEEPGKIALLRQQYPDLNNLFRLEGNKLQINTAALDILTGYLASRAFQRAA